jgi:hypothetical protein
MALNIGLDMSFGKMSGWETLEKKEGKFTK